MQVRRLKLRGAIGISRGLGREEIEIDFRKFGNGLIAVVGPNGAGKSTMLECLHPYRRLASREGSLQTHFYLRDSLKEVEFQAGNDIYLSKVFIDSHTGKSEAFLFKNNEPLNNGLTSTYDAALAKVLPDEKLFFVSAFTAQRAKGFADLKPSERKQLLIRLLNFERYQLYHDYAREKKAKTQADLEAKEDLLRIAEAEAVSIAKLLEEANQAEAQLTESTVTRDAAEDVIVETDKMLLTAREKVTRLQEALQRTETEKSGIAAKISELTIGLTKQNLELGQNLNKRKTIKAEQELWGKVLAELPVYEKMLAELKEVREQIAEMETSRRQLTELRNRNMKTKSVFDTEMYAWSKRKNEIEQGHVFAIAKLQAEIRSEEQYIAATTETLKKLEEAQKLLGNVPCAQVPEYVAECQLLGLARKNKMEVPEIKNAIAQHVLAAVNRRAAIESEDGQYKQTLAFHEELKPKEPQYEPEISFDVERFNKLRARQMEIEAVGPEAKIAGSKEGEKTVAVLLEQLKALTDADTVIAVRISEIEAEVTGYRAKYGELSEKDTTGKLEAARQTVAELEETRQIHKNLLDAAERVIAETNQKLAVIESKREASKAAEERSKQIRLEIIEKRKAISEWELLRMACSKDGIPALELSDAGPAITEIANTLLVETFGSDFQIAFDTQRETKEHKLKESFEVVVYGKGEETVLENLSGGEKVWVEKAIAEAITIHLNETTGLALETGYSDEADGALDPDRKQVYLDMLRAAHKRSNRWHTLVITHTEAIWAQITQRIILRPDTGEIEINA